MLIGVKIWAVAHFLANGDLGSICSSGHFWPGLSSPGSARKRRDEGPPHGAPLVAGGWRNDVLAVTIGTVASWAFVLWLHPWLIGVAVLPPEADSPCPFNQTSAA